MDVLTRTHLAYCVNDEVKNEMLRKLTAAKMRGPEYEDGGMGNYNVATLRVHGSAWNHQPLTTSRSNK